MTKIELQQACLATDTAYGAYYHRHFSLRRDDRSIPSTEPVTQDVLLELLRLQRAWEATAATRA